MSPDSLVAAKLQMTGFNVAFAPNGSKWRNGTFHVLGSTAGTSILTPWKKAPLSGDSGVPFPGEQRPARS